MNISAVKASKEFIRSRSDSNILCAVASTDLSLEGGTLTALSGPSGSGKSTILNMFAGLLAPTNGQIVLDGKDIYALDDKELSLLRNKYFGIIPQGQSALQSLTVLENVMVPYTLYNKSKGQEYDHKLEYAQELLKKADIWELRGEMPSELSGGELRRMAVCRALLMKPEVILADEPTSDLDEENTRIVMTMLKEQSAAGAIVLVVTHDRQVWDYADVLMEMRKGVLAVSTSELVNNVQE